MRFRGVLKDYATLWEILLRLADVSVVLSTGWIASVIYLGALPRTPEYSMGLILALLICLIVFPGFNVYRAWRGLSLGAEIRALSLAWLATLGSLTFLAFVTKTGPEFSRGWFLIWLCLGWTALVAGRAVLRAILHHLRQRGYNSRRIVVVGAPLVVQDVTERLRRNPWLGFQIAASFPVPRPREFATENPDPDDELKSLAEFVAENHIDQVWIAVPLKEESVLHQIQSVLRYTTADLRYIPDISSFKLLNHSISEIAGLPVINLSSSGMDATDRLVKAIEDRVLALLFLILTSPLMLLIAIGVKLSSPGPILFRQQRSGLGGVPITVLKFRSMVIHAEAPGQVTQARQDDPRITPFGAFLRRTSLDEFPQFFNALRGDMSIVGPRPHALEHNEQYKALVDRYMARHMIKPGITGWAQVNGYRGETDTLEKMQKRVEYDLYYMENWSLWFDLKIIGLTVITGFRNANVY